VALSRYLVDKSALVSATRLEAARQRLAALFTQRRALTCSIVDVEVLHSARTAADWTAIRDERSLGFERLDLTQAVFDRAIEVQGLLASAGRHRAPSIPDLVVAACAELHDVTVLHHDKDFDLIAEVTGQSSEWICPPAG